MHFDPLEDDLLILKKTGRKTSCDQKFHFWSVSAAHGDKYKTLHQSAVHNPPNPEPTHCDVHVG